MTKSCYLSKPKLERILSLKNPLSGFVRESFPCKFQPVCRRLCLVHGQVLLKLQLKGLHLLGHREGVRDGVRQQLKSRNLELDVVIGISLDSLWNRDGTANLCQVFYTNLYKFKAQ